MLKGKVDALGRERAHNPRWKKRRFIGCAAFWIVALLLITACGGGSGDSDDSPTSTNGASDAAGNGETSNGSSNSATITIGDAVYEFANDLPDQCQDNGSTLAGTFAMDADGNPIQGGDANRAVAVNFNIPVEDWEGQGLTPPQIGVDDASNNEQWQAGGLDSSTGVAPGDSEITSWEKGDGQASGAATFYDLKAHFAGQATEAQSGSFEITCGS